MKLCLRCNQYFDDPVDFCPNDQIALENVGKDPLIGALINNRYLVESVIGKGSSGIVYKARRLGRGEMVVAIKVLHSYIGAAGSALDRFLREAQAASRLRNPHIITIWESGVTEDGQPYFVMDYLEGTTLGHLIKNGNSVEPGRIVSILHQVSDALTEAHRLGIIHRDLKPENIVLQVSDHGHDYVKLLDFGIADSPQHAQSTFKLEKPRTVSGSPAYMSPEQCQGLDLDGRSDIYSLAIVVFEMLTGQRPFAQKDNVNVMVLHVNEPPMSLSQVRPDLQFSTEVESVIARALSKQPEQRYNTVQEFIQELESALTGGNIAVSDIKRPSLVASANDITDSADYSPRENQDVTTDTLFVQDGANNKSSWGNVSLQSSTKALVASKSNMEPIATGFDLPAMGDSLTGVFFDPPTTPDIVTNEKFILSVDSKTEITEPTKDELLNFSKNSLAAFDKGIKPGVKSGGFAALLEANDLQSLAPPQQEIENTPPPQVSLNSEKIIDKPLSEIGEQSVTAKNKTIERLLEAAKRGKPVDKVKLDENKEIPPIQEVDAPPQVVLANKNNSGPTASGWYPAMVDKPLPATQSVDSLVKPDVMPPKDLNLSAPVNIQPAEPQLNEGVSSPALDLSRQYLQSLSGSQSSSTSNNPSASITSHDISQLIANATKNIPLPTQASANNDEETGFFVKQKYRNSFSRIRGQNKPNRFDNSLVTTRARAASLKAETIKPPINLWHYAIGIVVAASLIACAFICYTALNVPIPPVTSIELLLKSGNYRQVIDILEGKALSAPLDQDEIDQLASSYLNLAKVELANDRPEAALALLEKVDPKATSAAESRQLKVTIKSAKVPSQVKVSQPENTEKSLEQPLN